MTQAWYDHIEQLADDLETTTEVIELYLNQSPKRVFIGSGEDVSLEAVENAL